jgi:hypothetical protein
VNPNRASLPGRTANTLFSLALLWAICFPFSSSGNVVVEWNWQILDCFRVEATAAPVAARNLAILHGAIYEAVNGIEGEFTPCRFDLPAPSGACTSSAAAAAAHEVLASLYPSRRAAFDKQLTNSMRDIPSAHKSQQTGILYGRAVAQAFLKWRATDYSTTKIPYIQSNEVSQWQRTPLHYRAPELPNWRMVVPFVITNLAEFRPAGPPPLTGERYAQDFNQVKELGAVDSKVRTAEQMEIARFWSDFSNTATPPGHWNEIAQTICKQKGLNLSQTARLFAVMNFAMADAGIVAWEAKYKSNFWRPVTAIREAERDGNSKTEADRDWMPLLHTPPFPEYVSGHSSFSGAASEVLKALLTTDEVQLEVASENLPGVVRRYTRLSEIADEIGMSRIYGGIHFQSAHKDGKALGRAIGRFCADRFLHRKDALQVTTARKEQRR